MIVSASRRTDIPAHYGDWFHQRLRAGYVLVRNPANRKQVSRVPLDRESVDIFVFWTKDPRPFFPVLDELDARGYPYFFHFTLNDYPRAVEPNIATVAERVATLRALSARIGPERIVWRYDPVLFTPEITEDVHLRSFKHLCGELEGQVSGCAFKFLDGAAPSRREFVGQLAEISRKHGIELEGCCGEDFDEFGVKRMVCVDRAKMERLSGRRITVRRDDCARFAACRSVRTVDIGAYDTCRNGCVYCYAGGCLKDVPRFDADSELLGPPLRGDENITLRTS